MHNPTREVYKRDNQTKRRPKSKKLTRSKKFEEEKVETNCSPKSQKSSVLNKATCLPFLKESPNPLSLNAPL